MPKNSRVSLPTSPCCANGTWSRIHLSLRAQVYLVSALFVGFFGAAPLVPDEFRLADEELADLMAETVHRTLEVDQAIPSDTLQTISHCLSAV